MDSDGVTRLEVYDDGSVVLDDVVHALRGLSRGTAVALTMEFPGQDGLQPRTLNCRKSPGGLTCDDGESYRRAGAPATGQVHGRYLRADDPTAVLALEKGGGYTYKVGDEVYSYSWSRRGDTLELVFPGGSPAGGRTLRCRVGRGALTCGGGLTFRRAP